MRNKFKLIKINKTYYKKLSFKNKTILIKVLL